MSQLLLTPPLLKIWRYCFFFFLFTTITAGPKTKKKNYSLSLHKMLSTSKLEFCPWSHLVAAGCSWSQLVAAGRSWSQLVLTHFGRE